MMAVSQRERAGSDLYDIQLAALFCDAVFLSVRPNGPKEGVLVAWGFTEQGERVLLQVMLGMRESHEDWLPLGRDLIARGLRAPLLVVADGAPGLIKAVEQCWPASDRQRCAVHRLRNLLAKLPERERERVRRAYWQALDDATASATASNDSRAWQASSTVPATPPPPNASPTTSTRSSCTCATRPDTGADGGAPTCWNARSPRSNGAPRVIGRFPGETSCLTLVWALLDLYITHATNGVRSSQLERQRLRRMRHPESDQTTDQEVSAA
jgi:putative transposase